MSNLNDVLHIKNQTIKSKNKEINALRVKVKELTRALAEEVSPPPFGKSCCEDAALNAAEVDRLTLERDELQALLGERSQDYVDTASERGELQAKLNDAEAERDELQAKLVEAQSALDKTRLTSGLDAAEQRPTLNREAVHDILVRFANHRKYSFDRATEDILALSPAVPSDPSGSSDARQTTRLPEWLGDVPDKPEVKLGAQTATVGGNIYNVYNHTAKGLRAGAWELLALADAIDAEEAKRNAEDEQRIEEQAERLYLSTQDELCVAWESLTEHTQKGFRAAIRAGWGKGGAA